MCVKSSRLMIAPSSLANANSSAGVSLEENMMCFPSKPWESASISSVSDAQSHPQSYSFKMSRMNGFGVAFTAKYSRNPGFHANACFTAFAFSRIPFHRRDEKALGIFLRFPLTVLWLQMVSSSYGSSFLPRIRLVSKTYKVPFRHQC